MLMVDTNSGLVTVDASIIDHDYLGDHTVFVNVAFSATQYVDL